jgi:hypothetical protein
LREEHRLRVFEKTVLRRIFGPKREEDGSWRKLHNDELHDLYSSPNKSRRMKWVGHVARMGEGRGVCRVLVRRPEGKRPLGRPRHMWEDNIRMDLREIGIDGANWTPLAQDRVQLRAFVNMVMNLRLHKESRLLLDKLSINFLKEHPAPWSKLIKSEMHFQENERSHVCITKLASFMIWPSAQVFGQ